jgi:hypothetical protein
MFEFSAHERDQMGKFGMMQSYDFGGGGGGSKGGPPADRNAEYKEGTVLTNQGKSWKYNQGNWDSMDSEEKDAPSKSDGTFDYTIGNAIREVFGGGLIASGQPWLEKRFVTKATEYSAAAASGTSVASKYLSKLLPQKMPIRVMNTKVLGRAVGRFVPYLGVGLLVWDAIDLGFEAYDSYVGDPIIEDDKPVGSY